MDVDGRVVQANAEITVDRPYASAGLPLEDHPTFRRHARCRPEHVRPEFQARGGRVACAPQRGAEVEPGCSRSLARPRPSLTYRIVHRSARRSGRHHQGCCIRHTITPTIGEKMDRIRIRRKIRFGERTPQPIPPCSGPVREERPHRAPKYTRHQGNQSAQINALRPQVAHRSLDIRTHAEVRTSRAGRRSHMLHTERKHPFVVHYNINFMNSLSYRRQSALPVQTPISSSRRVRLLPFLER